MFWPIHPQIQPDEILSSWMLRIAQANGFKAHTFYAQQLGRSREIWTRDIDHLAPDWLIGLLADRTGTSIEAISATTLRAFEGIVFERINATGATRWLLPLGIYHRTRRAFGQQFCPECLGTDAQPYLRRGWRLSIKVVCAEHGVLLLDRCAVCGKPLAPHRADILLGRGLSARASMRHCGYCRVDLGTRGIGVSAADVLLQRQLDGLLDQGYFELAGTPIYSHLFLNGLRLLMLGLRRFPDAAPRSHPVFEHCPPAERLVQLREAVSLLERWPEEFLQRCKQVRQAYSLFAREAEPAPFWLSTVLRRELFSVPAPLELDEACAILKATLNATGMGSLAAARRLSGRDITSLIRRQTADEDDVGKLIARLDHRIFEASGSAQALLLRDKVMFLVGRRKRMSQSALASLTVSSVPPCVASVEPFRRNADQPGDAECLLAWYATKVRPLLTCSGQSKALFVSCLGKGITPNTISERLQRAARDAGMRREVSNWTAWTARHVEAPHHLDPPTFEDG